MTLINIRLHSKLVLDSQLLAHHVGLHLLVGEVEGVAHSEHPSQGDTLHIPHIVAFPPHEP